MTVVGFIGAGTQVMAGDTTVSLKAGNINGHNDQSIQVNNDLYTVKDRTSPVIITTDVELSRLGQGRVGIAMTTVAEKGFIRAGAGEETWFRNEASQTKNMTAYYSVGIGGMLGELGNMPIVGAIDTRMSGLFQQYEASLTATPYGSKLAYSVTADFSTYSFEIQKNTSSLLFGVGYTF